MRVIAGKARRLQLQTVKGMNTRPTTDRIKETLFNMINDLLYDAVFLDLFSGSGAIGIEALSRGASKAYFVENNTEACNCIKNNLKFTHLEDNAVVMQMSYLDALKKINANTACDIIFMDPPYNKELEKEVLIFLSESDLINENSLIIVEASLETDMSYAYGLGFEIIKEKKYKTNKHVFLNCMEKNND
jgi:16S rRNA (guanine966-N2)-methyltransferase